MSVVAYERTGRRGVTWRFPSPAGDGELMIFASDIRRDSFGAKSYIRIGVPGEAMKAANDVRLRDSDERNALANAAALQMWNVKYTDERARDLRERMLVFCDGLTDFWIGSGAGEWVEGDKEPTAPLWAVPGVILKGAVGIHFGNAGANKSTVQRVLAQSLNYGVDTVFPVREQAQVLWVNAEEPPEEHKRQLGNVNAALGLERTTPLYTLDARGMSMNELAPRLEKAIEQCGAEHVFIDSLSRLAQGANLNENSTATMLIDSVSGLGPSMSFIGHTGQENHWRLGGSRHFENAARLMVRVQSRPSIGGVSPELTRGVRLTVTKANGAIETDAHFLTLSYHRQHGITAVERASEEDWPMLRCDFEGDNGAQCKRRTWDGVFGALIRCPRHRIEEED